MTLNDAQELFPPVDVNSPKGSFGYIYVTFEPISGKFYIGKKSKGNWQPAYYGSGHYPKKWKKEKLQLEHWPIQWCYSYEELNNAEYDWIDKFKSNNDITNLLEGGGDRYSSNTKAISSEYGEMISNRLLEYWKEHEHPMLGTHLSEDIKEKISETLKLYYLEHENAFKGREHTDDTKKLISEKIKEYYKVHDNPFKGKHHTPETKQKLREANIDYAQTHGSAFLGHKHTDEAKKIMSDKKKEYFLTHDNYWKGKHLPEEVKEKLRQKALERNLDPEFRKANSDRLKEYYKTHDAAFCGCQHTEETKEQMSKRKAELYDKERVAYIPNTTKLTGCAKDRRKVICLDTGEIFNSIVDASNAYGSKGSHIGDVCKGKRRTAFGKHWAFYEENSEHSSLPNYSYSNELGFLERKTCLA